MPRPCLSAKLTISGVAFSAAKMMSPSFSRWASSTTMIIRPARMRATACSTVRRTSALTTASGVVRSARAGFRRGALRRLPRRWPPLPCRRHDAASRAAGLVEQPRQVAGQQVHLEVHAGAARVTTGGGDLERVRDERHVAAIVLRAGDGQAHAVHGERALLGHEAPQRRRDGDGHAHAVALGDHRQHLADAVHVALHQVPAQALFERERPLQVHGVPHAQVPEDGPAQRLGHGLHAEAARLHRDHREADSAHGDAAADLRVREHLLRREPEAAARLTLLDAVDPAHLLDDPGEHQPPLPSSSTITNESSPTRPQALMRPGRARASEPAPSGPHQASPSAPSTRGAVNNAMRPTSPAPSQAVPSVGPLSSSTSWRPSRASRRASARGETRPAASGSRHTATPRRSSARARAAGAAGPQATTVPFASAAPKSRSVSGSLQARVADDAQRLAHGAPPAREPRSEPRVVGPRRARADDHGVRLGAQPVHEPPGRGPGDPLRAPGAVGHLAVQGHRQLPGHARQSRAVDAPVAAEHLAGLALEQPDRDLDPGRAQPAQAAAVHDVVRVAQRHDAAPHPRLDDGVHARRRAPVVRAGLERAVERRAPGLRARLPQGHHLGVVGARPLVPAAPDHAARTDDHRPDDGVGARAAPPPLGQGQGARHEARLVRSR